VIEDGGWQYLELPDVLVVVEDWRLGPVQDERKLDSACARPRAAYGGHERYTDVASKAASLGWGLTRAHGLVDGNKRLGAIATVTFFLVNGYDLAITQGELASLFLQIARGQMDQEELCLFLRSRAVNAPRRSTRIDLADPPPWADQDQSQV
jgi:death-on-curing protein